MLASYSRRDAVAVTASAHVHHSRHLHVPLDLPTDGTDGTCTLLLSMSMATAQSESCSGSGGEPWPPGKLCNSMRRSRDPLCLSHLCIGLELRASPPYSQALRQPAWGCRGTLSPSSPSSRAVDREMKETVFCQSPKRDSRSIPEAITATPGGASFFPACILVCDKRQGSPRRQLSMLQQWRAVKLLVLGIVWLVAG